MEPFGIIHPNGRTVRVITPPKTPSMAALTNDEELLMALADEIEKLREVIAGMQEKLDYCTSMGLTFGIMKTSNIPEGFLQHVWSDTSDFQRMSREWMESMGWEKEVEKARISARMEGRESMRKEAAKAAVDWLTGIAGDITKNKIMNIPLEVKDVPGR